MPTYDYMCSACGPFTALRPMSEYASPQPCARCAGLSPRALLSAPSFAASSSAARRAASLNERSANEPRRSAQHPSGCGCCARPTRRLAEAVPAAKSFPAARPWMISH